MKSIVNVLDRQTGSHSQGILTPQGRLATIAIIGAIALIAPVIGMVSQFWLYLFTRMMIFALLALSLDFIFGYAGLLSFGHAAMFGAGGYAVALAMQHVTESALVILPMAILVGFIVAAFIGWFSVRARGIYFAMLTLAFAQMLYVIAFTDLPASIIGVDQVTGGDNGLVGILMFEIPGIDLTSRLAYFYFTLFFVAGSLVSIVRLANSPFGRVLQGVRENEERVSFIGYNVQRYKVIAFAISGAFAGLAGGLYAPFQSIAHPSLMHWMVSGELIVMLLLGGMGTLWGPMIGAGLVVLLEEKLAGFASWEIILGAIFVVVVIFAPNGLAGMLVSAKNDPRNIPSNVKRAIKTYIEKVRGER
ncbi:branched-chain amino acid ABC transporter permease [Natrialbaceae archaeon A-gly3]